MGVWPGLLLDQAMQEGIGGVSAARGRIRVDAVRHGTFLESCFRAKGPRSKSPPREPGGGGGSGWRFPGAGFLSATMNHEPAFRLFGPAHLAAMGVTVGLPLVFWATARGAGHEGYRKGVRWGLAGVLAANWIAEEVAIVIGGDFNLAYALPMQLCDWATVAVVAALLTCRERVYEVAYFWGLAGTLQAILTPNLQVGFPSWQFAGFFVMHSGVVVGVLYLTAVEGLRPRAWSIVRAMLWSEVYFVAALAVNYLTGADYGFLSHRPAGKSLLDYLSDNHALYLLELQLLAVGFYTVLYAPFWVRDSMKRTRASRSVVATGR